MPTQASVGTDTATPHSKRNFTWLALGDSYTIGHNVPENENYPNQTVTLLKKDSLEGLLKIIATSGWTTDQLEMAISLAETEGSLLKAYDIVTLLIGVNNQYQGQEADAYNPKFEQLLKKTVSLTGNKPDHVIVISIPDWGVTPFGAAKDPVLIARQIDDYNRINKQLSQLYGVNYVDVTPETRDATYDASLLATDGLHYSGKEYALWADKLADIIRIILP